MYQELIVSISRVFYVELPEGLRALYKILLFTGQPSNQGSHRGHLGNPFVMKHPAVLQRATLL